MRQYRPCHTFVLLDFDTLFCIFRDIFDPVPHFFMIFVFFLPSIADGRGSFTDFALFFVLWPLSAKFLKRASRATASVSFIFRTPLALSRNFLKFLIYLCPTRVNFSTASSTTFPHQVEGAALLLGRLPPPFPFSVFLFRPGNLGLFRFRPLSANIR